jgi:hypothetical protein
MLGELEAHAAAQAAAGEWKVGDRKSVLAANPQLQSAATPMA